MKYPESKPKHHKLKDEYEGPEEEEIPEEGDCIQTQEPQEKSQGWWTPNKIVRLWEQRKISDSEFLLLGRISVLCDEKKGCWASNKHLAKWWGKSSKRVSHALSHLEELGVLTVSLRRVKNKGTYRSIWLNFDRWEGGGQKRPGGVAKNGQWGVYASHTKQSNPPNPPKGGNGVSFNLEEGRVFQACKDFRHFIKGRTGKQYTDHILQRRWRTVAESFVQEQLKGNQGHFLKVLDWYMQNIDGKYVPECLSIPRFCEKFRQIEKAHHRKEGTTPEEASEYKVTTVIRKSADPLEDTW